jgi:WXXGXW repeat (2 copies)
MWSIFTQLFAIFGDLVNPKSTKGSIFRLMWMYQRRNLMSNRFNQVRKLSMLGGLAVAAVVLTGCVVTPYPYYQTRVVTTQPSVAGTAAASVEYVQVAPPAPQYEVVTVSPGLGYVWTPGLWYWSGGRHVWRAGLWTRPPSGYSTWNNGGWTHVPGRGWQHNQGYWR